MNKMIVRESWNPIYLVRFENAPSLNEEFDSRSEAIEYAKSHIANKPTVEGFDAYFDAFGSIEKESDHEIVPISEAEEESEAEEDSLEDRLSKLEDSVDEIAERVEAVEETVAENEEISEDEESAEEPEEESEEEMPENPFALDFDEAEAEHPEDDWSDAVKAEFEAEPDKVEVLVATEIPAEDVDKIDVDRVENGEIEVKIPTKDDSEEKSDSEESEKSEEDSEESEEIEESLSEGIKAEIDEIVRRWDDLEEASTAEKRSLRIGGEATDDLARGRGIASIKDKAERDAAVAAVKAGRKDLVDKAFIGDRKNRHIENDLDRKAAKMQAAGLRESQSQEIAGEYDRLAKEFGVDVEELVYGKGGFMESRYPQDFPDFAGDVIMSKKYWDEFVDWAKKEKNVDLETKDELSENWTDEEFAKKFEEAKNSRE